MGELKLNRSVLVLMLPALFIYGLFFIVPFIQTGYYSFLQWDGITKQTFIGLDNYIALFKDSLFVDGIWKIVVWAILAIVIKVGIALILANVLRQPFKGSRFLKSSYFMPVIISSSAMCLIFTLMYDKDIGLINEFIRAIGLNSLARGWLSEEKIAFYSVIAVPIWQNVGLFFIILFAGIQDISEDIYDSATIDGANGWHKLVRITIPLLWSVIQVCIILAITGAMKNFDYIFILTGGGPGRATEVPATIMYKTIFTMMNYGYGTAMAMFIFFFGLVVSLVFKRMTRSDA
ncbi:carbohydrate ABC transporter permease [Paenibacillus agricola]|uniref:Sugar ABC transporter permease n=1 Tax=Paenibacillus agricola TaxID=2716264 RepID=A0ABX0JB38_9BACL|nr:sugar ABC transporter permease [Paenibacillus agricola]NHN33712.1 sugar ABC transporter permease [Paenibacillus agricola]